MANDTERDRVSGTGGGGPALPREVDTMADQEKLDQDARGSRSRPRRLDDPRRLAVSLPMDLHERVADIAKQEDRSVSGMLRQLIKLGLDAFEGQQPRRERSSWQPGGSPPTS